MKILHTSDWHLGKRLFNFSRMDEQKAVLEEIVNIARIENVDVVLVAGDLFDVPNPSNDAMLLLNNTLAQLSENGKRLVVALAGNHDSPDRIESNACFAQICGVLFPGYPHTKFEPLKIPQGFQITKSDEGFIEVLLPQCSSPLRLIYTPYANELRLKQLLHFEENQKNIALRKILQEHWNQLSEKYCDEKGVNILCAHLFFQENESDIRKEDIDEEYPINIGGASAIYADNIPGKIQYVAVGHLHRYQQISQKPCPIVYSGSPIAYSFAEENQDKYVLIVDAEPEQTVTIKPVLLKQGKRLLKVSFSSVNEAVEFLHQHPNEIIELTMKTTHYLTGNEKALLKSVHNMLEIIPLVKGNTPISSQQERIYELRNDMQGLFSEYFKKESGGQEPSSEIIDLFNEIISTPTKLSEDIS